MPRAAGNKKRKKDESKNEKPKAKKTKLGDCEGVNVELEDDKTSSSTSDVSCHQREDVVDIDELLDKNAAKNNLTAINVKSIIHHVVSDKRVLALVQSAMAAEESQEDELSCGNGTNTTADLELDFAPKMTRAKSKQAAQGDPIMALASQSPIKELRSKLSRRSKKIHFTELDLPESSSDEEYNPDDEEERSDEDTESCVSFASDLASPKIPSTPESHKQGVPNAVEDSTTAHTVTRSLSKRLYQEPFKLPYPVVPTSSSIPVEEATIFSEEGDLIAKRTRSQFPLLDTPIETIEATFQAPDFTPDMYDIIQEEDLDFDEIEWQKWLQGLINADNDDTFTEDDHEDTEYNFMAEEQKEEKEEYRNDRAVRIPQKEVNELMEELLKDYDDVCATDEETCDMFFLEVISPSCGRAKEELFNSHQLKQLTKQLQQHTQLLTQIFVMAHEEPSLSVEANLTRDYVNELKAFSDRASNAQLIRGLGDGLVHSSAFSFPGLEQAVTLVNNTLFSDGATLGKAKSIRKAKSTKSLHEDLLRPLSQTSMATMASYPEIFRFLELLPYCNLLPRTGDTPKLLRGLRVKFYEAEDTLLALGLQQFDKRWDLIQQHLLPVKTPKQLQNRCKNLLSARAPENIIKYYRRNKRLWDLPNMIESPGRRQWGRDSLEPEWLTDYRKIQKETRDKEEKRELLVAQQSAEAAAFGRPIVPKLRHTCPLAVKSCPSSADQVAWVAITGAGHSWGAVTKTQPHREVESSSFVSATATTHPPPVVSVDKDVVNTSTIKVAQPSLKESPPEHTAVELEEQATELPTSIEPVTRPEENKSGEAGRPPHSEQTAPSTTTRTTGVDPNKENQSEDATEKPALKKPNSMAAKAKPLRDKSLVGVTAGRVTSRSHCVFNDGSGGIAGVTSRKTAPHSQTNSMGNYILEPDPKFRDRAQAFAEAFLAKVKKQLKEDPETYEEFLRTLSTSSSEQCSPVELYRRVEVVLVQYPDLVEDFVGFLEPHQAVEAGVFMANLEFVRARTFLRKLEVHFQKSPSHFRKIINAFDSWKKSATKDPSEQTIIPMLKGQQHLVEELCSFFDDMKPPACSDDDFEEVEFGSGSESEVDDFEEVVIPCFVEQKKIKGRPVKATQKPGVKNPTGKTNTARKPTANVKGAKQQGAASKMAANRTKKGSSAGKNSASEGKKIVEGQDAPKGGHPKTPPNASTNSVNSGGDDGHDPQKTEVNTLEGPLTIAATSLQSETSNDSCRGEEFPSTAPDTSSIELEEQDRRSSYSEEQEDDANTDAENSPRDDGYEEEEYDYDDADVEREAAEYPDDVTSCDVDSDFTGGDFNTGVITSDADVDTGGCDSDVVVLTSEAVVPAKNLHRSEDGRLVIAWTREDDREILQACQKVGANKGTFQHVANVLHDKTADEVEKRFVDLMNLFKASTGERARESMNEESGSDDEDEEDSDAVVESEGEQDNAE